jgi:RimJ/RimL family protein N-acetyltransferase
MYAWMLDPVVREGIGLRGEPSLTATREWIGRALADTSYKPFAICLSDRHVGNVVLDRRDDYLQTARLSVYIGEAAARGCGVGTTAVARAARFAFEEWGLYKLWLIAHEENRAALAAYERVGFVREGRLRHEFLLAGRRVDAIYMGLLRADFATLAACGREEETS